MEMLPALYPQILLVDDDPLTNRIISAMLTKMGYHADCARNGAEALQLLQENHYRLVFMDFYMPDMTGGTVSRLLRTDTGGKNADVAVIALTASNYEETRQLCLDAGMDDVMVKPIKFGQLKDTVCRYL